MNKHMLETFRRKLLALEQRLDRQRMHERDEALRPTGGEASGGISNAPIHPSDLASRQSEEYVALGLVQNEEKLLQEVEMALQRLNDGTFGRCSTCHRPIAVDRLEAIPYARDCVACARQG